ncbi:MAG: SapC family protein [Gammaproteobacteria bacterium]
MDIATPPGYSKLVALDTKKHRGLGVVSRRQGFAAALNSVYLAAAEFIQAARHYPIVFAQDTMNGEFLPLAVTGLEQDINLFVTGDGTWLSDVYIPAFVRCWPFYGVRITGGGAKPNELLICVDETGLDAAGDALFDSKGKPTTLTSSAQTLIQELEGARNATLQLGESLKTLDLLTPFEAHALPKQGREMRLRGMYRVDETRLNALDGETIKQLMKSGELSRIYAHLTSMDNFKFLLDRVVTHKSAATASA